LNIILFFLIFQEEKSKIEERRKLSEQDVHRLKKEKEHSENIIQTLKKDIEDMNKMHEEQLERHEIKAKQMEEQLTTKVKETEYLLLQSNKKIEEVEVASRLKSQLWDRKENLFQNYMDNQQLYVKVCSLVVSNPFSFVLFFYMLSYHNIFSFILFSLHDII
jgi:kinesin family protein C2/C3